MTTRQQAEQQTTHWLFTDLEVFCPVCKAEAGSYCSDSEGVRLNEVHIGRVRASYEVLLRDGVNRQKPAATPTSARWDLLATGSVVADARSRTVAVNVETVHADDMPELLDAMGQACRFLKIDGAWEEPQDVTVGGFADMGRGGVRP